MVILIVSVCHRRRALRHREQILCVAVTYNDRAHRHVRLADVARHARPADKLPVEDLDDRLSIFSREIGTRLVPARSRVMVT